ncbi:hypothetical protein D1816_04410 [Aquimarina sp. AD10]|uniref:DUF6249 domain-containing protein n=1 Tax=Aquimarina aggregata TaxID=1642818 RepID=A0A163CG40_9FLAO|nr:MULTISPECIES: DUF6249 domain-containing protein [Aquimarina]AXT59628.1 hypothetical protein D1816_04410 [Aquimarina sp. AD10]KZS42377.1 hypothetical protein AWE51_02750 [Aquimarina aggregata]RKM94690.1 hypothetical protein D7033_17775 [Aquimarina sp. AD10]
MNELNEFFGLVLLSVTAILVVFIIARYTYLIKKAMIDKGINLEQNNTKYKYLDIGCIVFGLGVGLLVSSIFTMFNLSEDTTDLLVWGTILIFGAAGSVITHFIRKKLE